MTKICFILSMNLELPIIAFQNCYCSFIVHIEHLIIQAAIENVVVIPIADIIQVTQGMHLPLWDYSDRVHPRLKFHLQTQTWRTLLLSEGGCDWLGEFE